ncbi:MH2 domain-containing protein [Ditylenchus destructor]|uniref:Mothers against decapentaplegic homolog n=1 Tax=Ditylenchus destructor TaxID=166010 RepID=A0AAD4RBC5_9BILA|nr:MH2 domain-containing protein [Ditylenchus destructor]
MDNSNRINIFAPTSNGIDASSMDLLDRMVNRTAPNLGGSLGFDSHGNLAMNLTQASAFHHMQNGNPTTAYQDPSFDQFLKASASGPYMDGCAPHSKLDNQDTKFGQPSPVCSTSALPSTSHHQLPTSSDPCAHVVHVLLCYHQGGEDPEFIRKAIESLVKKLKDRRMELDALISAVTSGGKQHTGCVTIHRSLDGRLQVAGRKGVPHVVYARIWRWPNVNKNELQKLPICTTSNDHPDLICINPFHYDRVVSSGIGNIEMSSLRMDPLPSSSGVDGAGKSLPTMVVTQNYSRMESIQQSNQMDVDKDPDTSSNTVQSPKAAPFLMFGQDQQPSYVVSHLASGSTISNPRSVPPFQQYQPQVTQDSTNNNSETAQQTHSFAHATWNHPHSNIFEGSQFSEQNDTANTQLSQSANVMDTENSENPFGLQRYNTLRYNLDRVQIPQTQLPDHWCSIHYYELDTQVGETFKAPRELTEVTIDGGMDPAGFRSGRFCLGALSNVHRTEASEKARMHISKGVKLKTTPDGSVYLECLSQKGVFVRSYFLDFEHGLIYGSTVHKFCTGAEKKLFDLRWAFAEMCEQRESAQLAVVAQAYAVAGIVRHGVAPSLIERAGIGVDDLRRVCCTIAISFVKGWGRGYNRSSIKETPCWVEVHLHRPLQLLNLLLQKTE